MNYFKKEQAKLYNDCLCAIDTLYVNTVPYIKILVKSRIADFTAGYLGW